MREFPEQSMDVLITNHHSLTLKNQDTRKWVKPAVPSVSQSCKEKGHLENQRESSA
jgi:hypothetical protein